MGIMLRMRRGPQELRAPLEGPARDVNHAVHGTCSRTRRSPRVEQVEPGLAVDGDQSPQQTVLLPDVRPPVDVVAAGVVQVPPAGVAPLPGELPELPQAPPLERQPYLVHAEAPGDGGARLPLVPQGDELRVVGLVHEHVTASGLVRSRTVAQMNKSLLALSKKCTL